ncbi:hypothetical protein EDC01DRAFT_275090 [Geopyxis carbonaria]|nr:hypothetical protein EDC01DRAFT_275090 [Geopyxis carbonaria]
MVVATPGRRSFERSKVRSRFDAAPALKVSPACSTSLNPLPPLSIFIFIFPAPANEATVPPCLPPSVPPSLHPILPSYHPFIFTSSHPLTPPSPAHPTTNHHPAARCGAVFVSSPQRALVSPAPTAGPPSAVSRTQHPRTHSRTQHPRFPAARGIPWRPPVQKGKPAGERATPRISASASASAARWAWVRLRGGCLGDTDWGWGWDGADREWVYGYGGREARGEEGGKGARRNEDEGGRDEGKKFRPSAAAIGMDRLAGHVRGASAGLTSTQRALRLLGLTLYRNC